MKIYYPFTKKLFKKIFNKNFFKQFSSPAYIYEDKIQNNHTLISHLDLICPLCNDTGIVRCKLCKEGCLFCGYSSFIPCQCQSN